MRLKWRRAAGGTHPAMLLAITLILPAACAGGTAGQSKVDLAPFRAMAAAGGCTDVRNRLFLIDGRLVLWDRAGNCADQAYGLSLYGSTPDQVLCVYYDSIAGPVRKCQDEGYQDMFSIMAANVEAPDLGLGKAHTVQAVLH